MRSCAVIVLLVAFTGCGWLSDPATRIASDIKSGVGHLGPEEGARSVITHQPPLKAIESGGSYTVQFDKVGAIVVWYKDNAGKVTASGSTSYSARFIDTPQTYIVDKPVGAVVTIEIQRLNGRAVVVGVR